MNASNRISLKRFLLAATILSSPLILAAPNPAAAQVSVTISVPTAPPVLPVYDQPAIPDAGYLWTPGYWAWEAPTGYFWVPGTWVMPPQANVLWTPPYWGWSGGAYVFHTGYWGPQVGYYGGVDYGFGYGGRGYEGGRWQGGHFAYNRTVNNFGSVQVTNVYESKVTVLNTSQVSYVGGTGGLRTEPTAEERRAEQEHHVPMTPLQTSHIAAAAKLPDLAASHNSGHPAIVATSRPNQFEGAGVIRSEPSGASAHAGAPPADAARPGQAADHATAAPAQHEAERPAEHAATPPATHEAARPVEHAATPPAAHEAVRPAEHVAAPPVAHEAVRPVEHATAPSAVHEPVRPAEHAATPPAAREAPRPADHSAATPPAAHETARPAEHAAAPAATQHAFAQAPHPAPAAVRPAPEEKGKDKP